MPREPAATTRWVTGWPPQLAGQFGHGGRVGGGAERGGSAERDRVGHLALGAQFVRAGGDPVIAVAVGAVAEEGDARVGDFLDEQVAGRDRRLLAGQVQFGAQPMHGGGDGRLRAVVGLHATGGEDYRGALGHCLAEQGLQLADLVAAGRDTVQVFAFGEQFRAVIERGHQAGQPVQRGRAEAERDTRERRLRVVALGGVFRIGMGVHGAAHFLRCADAGVGGTALAHGRPVR